MNFIELESERLLFRKYKIEDYSVFYDMLSNLENMKYRSSEPKNTEEVQRYIDWGIQCAHGHQYSHSHTADHLLNSQHGVPLQVGNRSGEHGLNGAQILF